MLNVLLIKLTSVRCQFIVKNPHCSHNRFQSLITDNNTQMPSYLLPKFFALYIIKEPFYKVLGYFSYQEKSQNTFFTSFSLACKTSVASWQHLHRYSVILEWMRISVQLFWKFFTFCIVREPFCKVLDSFWSFILKQISAKITKYFIHSVFYCM